MSRNSREWCCIGLFAATAFVSSLVAIGGRLHAGDEVAREDEEARQRVMIVTGEDYRGHHWKKATPKLKSQLAKDPRFEVETTEDLFFLRSPKLHDYQVIVLHFKNHDPAVPGRRGYDNLTKFVEAGGGLVLVHFASGAFQEFKGDFVKLAGRVWNPEARGHDAYGPFAVEIVATDHPITKGLRDFKTTDEFIRVSTARPRSPSLPRRDRRPTRSSTQWRVCLTTAKDASFTRRWDTTPRRSRRPAPENLFAVARLGRPG